jgi:hypothetical protein
MNSRTYGDIEVYTGYKKGYDNNLGYIHPNLMKVIMIAMTLMKIMMIRKNKEEYQEYDENDDEPMKTMEDRLMRYKPYTLQRHNKATEKLALQILDDEEFDDLLDLRKYHFDQHLKPYILIENRKEFLKEGKYAMKIKKINQDKIQKLMYLYQITLIMLMILLMKLR